MTGKGGALASLLPWAATPIYRDALVAMNFAFDWAAKNARDSSVRTLKAA